MTVSFWLSFVYALLNFFDMLLTEYGLITGKATEANGLYFSPAIKALKVLSPLILYIALRVLEGRGHYRVLLGVGLFVVLYYIVVVVNNILVLFY